jgi:hypothetical protein
MNSSAESGFVEDKMPLKKGNEIFFLLLMAIILWEKMVVIE